MADNPPITTTVPETVTVDTGADPKSLETLNESFADFWAAEDAKTDETKAPAAPAAPSEGAAQETKREATPAPVPVAEKSAKIEKVEPAKVPTGKPPAPILIDGDEDIDAIQMPSDAHPRLVDHVGKIKELWKGDRAKARALRAEMDKIAVQLAEARQNAMTPELKADYENAVGVRRKVDIRSDPEFQAKYERPIWDRYYEILHETANALTADPNDVVKWLNDMKGWPGGPNAVNKTWWQNSVLAMIPNPMDRESVQSSINELLRMQRTRDAELVRNGGDGNAFDQYQTERNQAIQQRVQEEILAEIELQKPRFAAYMPRDIEQAKTKEEREAIAAHNERFERYNGFFNHVLHDLSKVGPRAWVRASMEATRAEILAEEYGKLESELKSAKEERDKFKAELEKIHGARRKLATTPAAPAAAKKDGSISLKDLDVRKSFESYDWGDK